MSLMLLLALFIGHHGYAGESSALVINGYAFTCSRDAAKIRESIEFERSFRKRISFDSYVKENRMDELYDTLKRVVREEPRNYVARVEMLLIEQHEYTLLPTSRVPTTRRRRDTVDDLIAVHRINPAYYKLFYAAATPVYEMNDKIDETLALMDCAVRQNPALPDAEYFYVRRLANVYKIEEAFVRMKTALAKGYTRAIEAAIAVNTIVAEMRATNIDIPRRREIAEQACGWTEKLRSTDTSDVKLLRTHLLCLSELTYYSPKRRSDLDLYLRELRARDAISAAPAYYETLANSNLRDFHACVRSADQGLKKIGDKRAGLLWLKARCELAQGKYLEAWPTAKLAIEAHLEIDELEVAMGQILPMLGAHPQLSQQVRTFTRSLDIAKVPMRDVWLCDIEVGGYYAPWRPRGQAAVDLIRRCRTEYAKRGLTKSRGENLFLLNASVVLHVDKMIEDSWAIQDELITRDPNLVDGMFCKDYVSRKIEREHDPAGALAVIRWKGAGTTGGRLCRAWYHYYRHEMGEAARIAGALTWADLEPNLKAQLPLLLANLAMEDNDPRAALKLAEKNLEDRPSAENLVDAVRIVDTWKGSRAALRYLKSHYDSQWAFTSPHLWTTWASLLDNTGRRKEALEKLKLAESFGPNDPETLINLATTYAQDFKDCASARPLIERAAQNITDSREESYLMGLVMKCGLRRITIHQVYGGLDRSKAKVRR